jgi:hypothetical protein
MFAVMTEKSAQYILLISVEFALVLFYKYLDLNV